MHRFVDEGEGTPVIRIHGWTGTTDMWVQTGTAPMLTEHFRVIAIDCRGHVRSGKPHHATSCGTHMIADVVELMSWLKIEKAHFIGYSMGAEIE
jgi:pimeloyl-ACP methyl ester carboxylesterase